MNSVHTPQARLEDRSLAMSVRYSWFATCLLATLFAAAAPVARADDKTDSKPVLDPATVQSLAVEPAAVTLRGRDSMQQVFVTAKLAGEALADLTKKASYKSSDEKIARVDTEGVIHPIGDGTAEIVAEAAGKSVKVAVTVSHMGTELPINF